MKRVFSIFLFLLMLCAAAAQATEPDGYVATGGRITDQQIYSGAWQQAYMQILNSHSDAIHAYQARTLEYYIDDYTVQVPCKPVSLADMTGDGIPELIFMEDANGMRGDLYIYSTDGTATRCALYVPGITRIGYDDAGMNFDIYLSSANGGTLVLEYDEYEWPWVLQLTRNAFGQYTLLNYLRAEYDNSNEANDLFWHNGSLISYSEYAAAILNGSGTSGIAKPEIQKDGVMGLTVDKLATRTGPGTQYEGGGTYSVKNQWIKVLSKAWDKRNKIWWVKCEIPYHGEIRVLWTGWKRFDHTTISLDDREAVLYPAICTERHSRPGENNLGWIKKEAIFPDRVCRIGLAHGAIEGVSIDQEGAYFQMSPEELEWIPVDVWLIGHTHVPYPRDLTEEYREAGKIFNAGSHVQNDVSTNTEGLCFVIEIADDKKVRAKKIVSGNLRFHRIPVRVTAGNMKDELSRAVEGFGKDSVVELILSGAVTDEEYGRRKEILDGLLAGFIEGSWTDYGLSRLITEDLIDAEYPETGIASGLLKSLLNNPREAQLAYDLLKEMEGTGK